MFLRLRCSNKSLAVLDLCCVTCVPLCEAAGLALTLFLLILRTPIFTLHPAMANTNSTRQLQGWCKAVILAVTLLMVPAATGQAGDCGERREPPCASALPAIFPGHTCHMHVQVTITTSPGSRVLVSASRH